MQLVTFAQLEEASNTPRTSHALLSKVKYRTSAFFLVTVLIFITKDVRKLKLWY
jgi:hypothetical protein